MKNSEANVIYIITPEMSKKILPFLIPRLLAILCLTGLLAGYATLLGVCLAWRLPDFRSSHSGTIRDDVMWVLFLSQLAIIVPCAIYVFCKKWRQIEFDNSSKKINRFFKIIALTSIGGFLAIHARVLHEAFRWEYDGEFMGCAIMYLTGVVAFYPVLRKYRIEKPNITYETIINDSSYKRSTWMYLGLSLLVFILTIISLVCFYNFVQVPRYGY